jgi:UDP-2,3-diacylglucosamine pyrophosphatase LpxH
LIQPIKTTPFDVGDFLEDPHYSDKLLFFYYGEFDKIVLMDSGVLILEFWTKTKQIILDLYHSECPFLHGDEGICVMISFLKEKYPEVADWFLFNISSWSNQ